MPQVPSRTDPLAIGQESDFRDLVLAHLGELPPQQQLIATFLLEHLREVPFLSVPEMSERTGASEATVVRLAQRLGYEGFSELKMVLLELVRGELRPTARSTAAATERPDDDTLSAVVRLEQHNLRRAAEGIERRQFHAAAAALFKADHVFAFGMGVSAYLAELSAYLLAQIGLRATAVSTRFTSPREQLVALRPTDLVLVFSFPPYSKQTVSFLEEASERALPSLVITDRQTATAARLARHLFVVPTHNMLFTNAITGVVALLNALVTEIAVRHQGKAVEALSRINRILSEDEDVLHEPSDQKD